MSTSRRFSFPARGRPLFAGFLPREGGRVNKLFARGSLSVNRSADFPLEAIAAAISRPRPRRIVLELCVPICVAAALRVCLSLSRARAAFLRYTRPRKIGAIHIGAAVKSLLLRAFVEVNLGGRG